MTYDDLKVSQVEILRIVASCQPLCVADVHKAITGTRINRSSLYYSCNKLIEREFLSGFDGEDADGGKLILKITPAGLEVLEDFQALVAVVT